MARQRNNLNRSNRFHALAVLAATLAMATVASGSAWAGSRSALVMVSVRVVETCRVETSGAGNSTDLSVRCNAKARPTVGLTASSQSIAPVATVTIAHSDLPTTDNGKILSIDF